MDPRPGAIRQHVPNALVVIRLVLAAVFVVVLSRVELARSPATQTPLLWWAVGLFLVACLTDAADGRLARRWNCVTRFGRIMDSFADKALVLAGFVLLASPGFSRWEPTGGLVDHLGTPVFHRVYLGGFLPWMVVVILAREFLVTSLRGLVEGEGGDFSAIGAGKIKMIVQAITIPLILALLASSSGTPGPAVTWGIQGLAILTVLVTVWSAGPYMARATSFLGQRHPELPQRADQRPEPSESS